MDISKITSFKSACQLTTLGGKGKDLEVCALLFHMQVPTKPASSDSANTVRCACGVLQLPGTTGFSSSLGPLCVQLKENKLRRSHRSEPCLPLWCKVSYVFSKIALLTSQMSQRPGDSGLGKPSEEGKPAQWRLNDNMQPSSESQIHIRCGGLCD